MEEIQRRDGNEEGYEALRLWCCCASGAAMYAGAERKGFEGTSSRLRRRAAPVPATYGWIWGDVASPARLCARGGGIRVSRALLVGRDAKRHQCRRFVFGYGETLRLRRVVAPPALSIGSGVQEGLMQGGKKHKTKFARMAANMSF